MARIVMINDEVYARLRALKKKGESFGSVILRLMNQRKRISVLDLAGKWPYSREKMKRVEDTLEESWSKGCRQLQQS